VSALWHDLASGRLTVVTIVVWTFCGFVVATAGGALSGIRLAGKDLGNELAAMMGAMFGPTGAVPGILLGLIILALM
jgi:hypothetical protein